MAQAAGENSEHPLKGYWLYRSSVRGEEVEHFGSIMDLADEKKAEELTKASGKTADSGYVEERQKVEAWLKAEGEKKGFRFRHEHPVYFRLSRAPVTDGPDNRMNINIPAELIPPDQLTLTMEDSFDNYAKVQGRPYSHRPFNAPGRVFSASEFREHIAKNGFPDELDGKDKQRYIECQVWTRDIPAFQQSVGDIKAQPNSNHLIAIPASWIERVGGGGLITPAGKRR